MTRQLSMLRGVLGYEFRMQIRRRAVWITFFAIMLAFALLYVRQFSALPGLIGKLQNEIRSHSLLTVVVIWTGIVNIILPLAVGALIADRLPRDKRTKVDELLATTPAYTGTRLLGKYIGSTVATLVPMLTIYLIGVVFILFTTQNLLTLPLALMTFVVIALPGLLFVGAFSVACPAVLWVPLYQFLFIGYWFWGNLFSPFKGIPTLSGTILTPDGKFISAGYFGVRTFLFTDVAATPMLATASIVLLLTLAVGILIVLWYYMRWERSRQ